MDALYPTATVSGMTGIPIRTIQDYVKAFREFFSETARQPAKGRRFTDQDVNQLLTIKRLRAERMPDEDIRKFLSGEIKLPLADHHHEADIKRMAADAYKSIETVRIILEQSEELIAETRATLNQLRDDQKAMQNKIKDLEDRLDKTRNWQAHMMKLDPDFNPYNERPAAPAQAQPAKPGFLERILGGGEE